MPLNCGELSEGPYLDISTLWNSFQSHLLACAIQHIPSQMVSRRSKSVNISKTEVIIKHIGTILRWMGVDGKENIVQAKFDRVHEMLPETRLVIQSHSSREDLMEYRASLMSEVKREEKAAEDECGRFFVERRMNNLAANTSRAIHGILERQKANSSIDIVKMPDGSVAFSPEQVKGTTADHFANCFRERQTGDPFSNPEWRDLYLPGRKKGF